MASRFIYLCGCIECGDITCPCEEHKDTHAIYEIAAARPNSCVKLENIRVDKKVEETIIVDPTTGGAKGSKLARFDLLPSEPLWELAEHYGKGEQKYPTGEDGIPNWMRGYDWRLSVAGLERHLHRFIQGEDIDAETGSSHLIAIAWHAFALRWFQLHNKGADYRQRINA